MSPLSGLGKGGSQGRKAEIAQFWGSLPSTSALREQLCADPYHPNPFCPHPGGPDEAQRVLPAQNRGPGTWVWFVPAAVAPGGAGVCPLPGEGTGVSGATRGLGQEQRNIWEYLCFPSPYGSCSCSDGVRGGPSRCPRVPQTRGASAGPLSPPGRSALPAGTQGVKHPRLPHT